MNETEIDEFIADMKASARDNGDSFKCINHPHSNRMVMCNYWRDRFTFRMDERDKISQGTLRAFLAKPAGAEREQYINMMMTPGATNRHMNKWL